MIIGDYHTHTTYSHGTGSVMDNALSARDRGLKEIAITDHGFNHVVYGIRRRQVDSLIRDCKEATVSTGVRVLSGIEANINGVDSVDLRPQDIDEFDIILAGFHKIVLPHSIKDMGRLFVPAILQSHLGGKITTRADKHSTMAVVHAIERYPIDILTHVSYGLHANAVEVAKACSDYGTYLELNGKRICMTRDEFEEVLKTKVRFIIDSDTHSPERVGDDSNGLKYLAEYSEEVMSRVVNIGSVPKFPRATERGK